MLQNKDMRSSIARRRASFWCRREKGDIRQYGRYTPSIADKTLPLPLTIAPRPIGRDLLSKSCGTISVPRSAPQISRVRLTRTFHPPDIFFETCGQHLTSIHVSESQDEVNRCSETLGGTGEGEPPLRSFITMLSAHPHYVGMYILTTAISTERPPAPPPPLDKPPPLDRTGPPTHVRDPL